MPSSKHAVQRQKAPKPLLSQAPAPDENVVFPAESHEAVSAARVIQLQRIIGNRAVTQQLQRGALRISAARHKTLVQRKLTEVEKGRLRRTIEGIGVAAVAGEISAGATPDQQRQNYIYVKDLLRAAALSTTLSDVNDAAADMKSYIGKAVLVLQPEMEDFSSWVDVQGDFAMDIEFKRLAYNWGKGGPNGPDQKEAINVGGVALMHRTQKAGNHSLWYQWNGNKMVLYATAEHYGAGNRNYRLLSGAANMPNTWHI